MIRINVQLSMSELIAFIRAAPGRIDAALAESTAEEAGILRDQMVAGFDSGAPGGQAFAAHSPLTVVVRRFRGQGGNKVMVATQKLRNSIVAMQIGGGAYFVGVRRTSPDLASIHEQGRTFTVPFTSRMRKFLFAAMGQAGLPPRPRAKGAKGTATLTIRIPARPFVGPVVDNIDVDAVRERVAVHIRRALGVS